MKRIVLFALMLVCAMGVFAQTELQRLLTTYTKSVRVPFYTECRMDGSRVPRNVNSVAIDGDVLTIEYVVPIYETISSSDNNTYSVRIELSKTTMSVSNTMIFLSCPRGIEIMEENGKTGEKYPFLVQKWSIRCNDTPLLERLVEALRGLGKLKENNNESALEGNAFRKVGNSVAGRGNSWSLAGRSLVGELAIPSCERREQGVVVVNIRVDVSGKVIDALIGYGTTITSSEIRAAAIEAAKKNVFSTGNSPAVGTITYRFALS